jgi:integrase
MGYSDLDPALHERRPWNAGQNVGPKRPLKPRDIWAIRFYLDEHRRLRDRAMFDLAIDSKLRGCDLVKIKIGDVTSGGGIRNRSTVIQQTTGRPVQFEIMSEARRSLEAWLERRRGTISDFAFPSRVDYLGHLSTRQYARLVDEWISTIGLDRREYGTHSLRRTKASLIYKATGNLRAEQILLSHTNIANTVRYLGVDIDDALTLSERTEIWTFPAPRSCEEPVQWDERSTAIRARVLAFDRRLCRRTAAWNYRHGREPTSAHLGHQSRRAAGRTGRLGRVYL